MVSLRSSDLVAGRLQHRHLYGCLSILSHHSSEAECNAISGADAPASHKSPARNSYWNKSVRFPPVPICSENVGRDLCESALCDGKSVRPDKRTINQPKIQQATAWSVDSQGVLEGGPISIQCQNTGNKHTELTSINSRPGGGLLLGRRHQSKHYKPAEDLPRSLCRHGCSFIRGDAKLPPFD